ncbi:hypothetical protein AIOL_002351 [Candidatus Rhodobacter oscarellae]|uniref:Uncharacterized protein n=1 Tax=Candidatus Rhodobacter oscarellae TaxID=1675527 RepID=A0A0J9GUY4_9RHOB|nr:LptF/LptG family permease [Candidatus Rhodobacter lobularis]KMW57388.1 hypothetical protein AIOL_002351 [Candidatus Rhodobacter lobularis]
MRLLGPRTFWLFAGLIVLIESIYLAEEFTTLLGFIVENGGTIWDTLRLSLLKLPEVVDFALPIAVLIALYFAIVGARETNELVVCAAAGVPWTRVPGFAAIVGALGFCLSLAFASWITPTALYTQRILAKTIEARSVVREITEPGHKNSIRRLDGRSYIATPPADLTKERGHLFIFEPDTGDGWRASQADDWSVIGPREDESYAIQLKSYRDYTGRTPEQQARLDQDQAPVQSAFQAAQWNVQNVALVFRLEELIKPIDLQRRSNERVVLLPIVAVATGAQAQWQSINGVVGQISGRALGCILAALTAVACAAGSGTWIGRVAGVPVGVLVVLAGDVVARAVLAEAAMRGPAEFAASFALSLLVMILLPMAYVLWRREALIVPRRGQG